LPTLQHDVRLIGHHSLIATSRTARPKLRRDGRLLPQISRGVPWVRRLPVAATITQALVEGCYTFLYIVALGRLFLDRRVLPEVLQRLLVERCLVETAVEGGQMVGRAAVASDRARRLCLPRVEVVTELRRTNRLAVVSTLLLLCYAGLASIYLL